MLRLMLNNFFRCGVLLITLAGCSDIDNDGLSVDLTCDKADVEYNSAVTLTWETKKADACKATGAWEGSRSISGSETIDGLVADSSFTLECSDGAGDSASDTVTVTVGPNHQGTASLSWTPPTKNTDNSPLTDLAGYKIYFGTAPGTYSDTITVDDGTIDSYVVENLAPSTWYFAVSAFDADGNESGKSNEAIKEITQ